MTTKPRPSLVAAVAFISLVLLDGCMGKVVSDVAEPITESSPDAGLVEDASPECGEPTPLDAGLADAPSPVDAGLLDASPWPTDAGLLDASPWPTDAGLLDASPWPTDAGLLDASPWPDDSGLESDADAAPEDAGTD